MGCKWNKVLMLFVLCLGCCGFFYKGTEGLCINGTDRQITYVSLGAKCDGNEPGMCSLCCKNYQTCFEGICQEFPQGKPCRKESEQNQTVAECGPLLECAPIEFGVPSSSLRSIKAANWTGFFLKRAPLQNCR